MRVLFCVNEVRGLYQLGGLGDVARDLPEALFPQTDIRLAVPFHPEIEPQASDIQVDTFSIIYNHQRLTVTVFLTSRLPSALPVYLFHEPVYLSQHTNESDNHADKYAVFSLAVSTWVAQIATYWQPQLIHLNDWHTALIPLLLQHKFQHPIPSILTIHNLAFQGDTDTPIISKLELDPHTCQMTQADYADNRINIMLQGIIHTDYLVAVSPTYAQEITAAHYGEGLETYLKARQSNLTGILNGLSTYDYQPATDHYLSPPFTPSETISGKAQNKQVFCQTHHLNPSEPLIGYIGRVDSHQKGIPLLLQAIKSGNFPPHQTNFFFLGTGEPDTENELHQFAKPHLQIATRFDEALAHQLYAAADILVIPSTYEPCGLVQLIAMRYGTLPVAFATGGLKDTIIPNQTGILFTDYSISGFVQAVDQALTIIANQQTRQNVIHTMVSQDFSWRQSAPKYAKVYQKVIDQT